MKRTTLGIGLIIAPFVGLFGTLVAYTIFLFVIMALVSAAGSTEGIMGAAEVVRFLFGLVGLASVLGIFIGIPIGIYLLVVDPKVKTAPKK